MSPLAISLRFLQTQPDQRLVELARAGHERAFEALVRRYRGPLLAYCRRIAPSGTPPEDILQQGLLLAWRALSGGAEVRDPRSWLYRIVHNVAITALRAGRELPDGVFAEQGALPVDQLVEQRIAAREALAGLAGLPELQRQVMVSAALDGRSHDEIAAALGLSSGSVRGLIYRARSTLRAAAAAVIPAPVIEWALGDAGGASAGLAGAASAGAGLGALALKGGAVLAVGAVAGTAGIVLGHQTHRSHDARQSASAVAVSPGGERTAAAAGAPAPSTGGGMRLDALVIRPEHGAAGAGSRPDRGEGSHDRAGRGGPQGTGHDGSGDGRGPQATGGGDGSQGDGSGSGGGDLQATTTTSGSDGGGGHGTATAAAPSGSDGSRMSSDGRGSSSSTSGGSSAPPPSGSDGGSGGSRTSGSDGGPSAATTTVTGSTTTAAGSTTTTDGGGH